MMGSHTHSSYKASAAPWIAQLPSHWDECPLFAVASERRTPNLGMRETNLLSLSYGRIVRKDINTNHGLLPESFETYQIIEPGDVIFRLTDLQNDQRSLRSGLSEERGIITSAYTAVVPEGVSPQFFSYLMRSYDAQKVFYSMGGGLRQSLNYSDLRRMTIPTPPQNEQQSIVEYLDQETGRMDSLIEKKRRFIVLLKEKRAALITSAVTKGLNRSVTMMDSGLLCLGEHPEHWAIMRIGQVFRQRLEKVSDSDFPPLSVTKNGIIPQLEHVAKTDDNDNRKLVRFGDFVINSRSDRKGSAGIAEQNGSVSLINTVLIPSDLIDPRFCHHLFRSTAFQEEFYRMGRGLVADLWSTNFSLMKRIVFALPPKDEQRAIGAFLDLEIDRMDVLISKAERSIELIREHRTALITAAVTGKIDVRNAA